MKLSWAAARRGPHNKACSRTGLSHHWTTWLSVTSWTVVSLSLLKNELRVGLGGDKQKRAASPISRRSTLIAMMQTADLGEGNDVARGGKLHATRSWAVFVEREMRSGVMMILKIARQDAAQVTLVEDDDVIQTFTADRTDETLGVGVLPGGSRGSDDLRDSHRSNSITECRTILVVTVPQ